MAETLDRPLPRNLQDRACEVLQLACERERKLVTAESCTGGLLAALLTDIEGYSHVFERGFVVYSDQAKCDLLGLDREEVENCGAVSSQVALKMAQGALRRSRAHVAVSITGFAGPGAEGDEEGLVHFGCAQPGRKTQRREEHFGPIGRDGVRIAALDVALAIFEEALKG